ncbi:DUF6455 family protein [Bradyrhizobium sp.]|uniref:DUF6455 family protein n=1 Tax=Bradyrhizobium sp. TaxID=376 RepID=UPI00238F5732|nr:DUF6455 family protein [Bradyrhizobium sp.]MDE2378020.1 hypothetical protein [Bradyrhizobium sp.]
MSTENRPYPIVQELIDSFAGWLKHRRELREMREMDRFNFDRIANDLRVTPLELEELVRHGPHAADELSRMLEQLGIDEERLAHVSPLLLRDLERVCAMCPDKAKCHRELTEGTAAEHYHEFCLNASTLETLDYASITKH